MSEVALIINVQESPNGFSYSRGQLGVYTVPPAVKGQFGLLVVKERGEIQDVGNMNRKVNEPIPARKIAEDILGYGSERMEKVGLLICAAGPDYPRDLEKAEREERDFLNAHPPEVGTKFNPVSRTREVVNQHDREPYAFETKIKLASKIQKEREKFYQQCRTMVTKDEIAEAKANMLREDRRIVAEGDMFWSIEASRKEITVKHHNSCIRLGLEKPWCYEPAEQEDCVGCGKKHKLGIAMCSNCGAILDEQLARKLMIGPFDPRYQQKSA